MRQDETIIMLDRILECCHTLFMVKTNRHIAAAVKDMMWQIENGKDGEVRAAVKHLMTVLKLSGKINW
jgi:hypothetical protein